MTVARRPPKTAMLVAQRIVRDVVRGGLAPGDVLPAEREMALQYGTSRGTLRESLRLLEFEGVVAFKAGPGGGPVLLDPGAAQLTSTVSLLMQLKRAPFRAIVEVRTAVEPVTSALAATRISPEQLAELAETIDQMRDRVGDQQEFLAANKRFHAVLSVAAGNELFGFIVGSVLDILDGATLGVDYAMRHRPAVVAAHERILEALVSADATLAQTAMLSHIREYERYIESRFPAALDRVVSW